MRTEGAVDAAEQHFAGVQPREIAQPDVCGSGGAQEPARQRFFMASDVMR